MTAIALERGPIRATDNACPHCNGAVPPGRRFCCAGCQAAFTIVQNLGLGAYYARRVLDPAMRPPRPEAEARHDLTHHIHTMANGDHELTLAVDGLQCGACVWLIEALLAREPSVRRGRVNMTTRRLHLLWRGLPDEAERLVGRIEALGYRLIPFNVHALGAARGAADARLLRALGVAGFAAGNVMLMSIGVWSGLADTMGPATRSLLHWVSALIAMPAIAYAGMPFFASAWAALRARRTNMDVPVSVGVVLVSAMSLVETLRGGQHTYYDSASALLFFLLLGRVLDSAARATARITAEQLLALRNSDVTVQRPDGTMQRMGAENVPPGASVLVSMGERIGVDGILLAGEGVLDTSLVSGESAPTRVRAGDAVFAGTLNLGAPITVRAMAAGGATLLAECARLIEAAEVSRGRFVMLADRVARAYAPTVHTLALLTFLGWAVLAGASWYVALLSAAAVLVITCPCALALAVPAVRVVASTCLFRAVILLKSPTALERLASVDMVVFDKTGTLTLPAPCLSGPVDQAALRIAASLAAASRHPLARALSAAAGAVPAASGVTEHPGRGLSLLGEAGETRLGSRTFCGLPDDDGATGPELWLTIPGQAAYCFAFAETPRDDAAASLRALRGMGIGVRMLTGDRAAPARRVAALLGIVDWRAGLTPPEKRDALAALARQGHKILMVGDGLNDSPALAAAMVSASPASAADISQTIADAVFQGEHLAPVVSMIAIARRAARVMRQKLVFSLAYNTVMVPLAMAGWVTPWLAAAAMSGSSLVVVTNSLRLRGAAMAAPGRGKRA